MASPRWRKVVRDLVSNKLRTALVVLSIAIGVFAVGIIAGTQAILTRDLQANYLAINPPAAVLGVSSFDDDLVQTIQRMPGVGEAEGRSHTEHPPEHRAGHMAHPTAPGHPGLRRYSCEQDHAGAGRLAATKAHDAGRALLALSGQPRGSATASWSSWRMASAAPSISRARPTTSICRRPASPAWSDGFVTFETLEWLEHAARGYTALYLTVDDTTLDRDGVGTIVNDVRDKIEADDHHVSFAYVPIPGKHPADQAVQPLLLILGVLGALSLLLSGFLVVNTISALLLQQTRQIGVMKAVGARTGQIMGHVSGHRPDLWAGGAAALRCRWADWAPTASRAT